MTERSIFDPFEQRIAAELERFVAPAVDATPAADIARLAMRPRRLVVQARNASRSRRFLLLGLAAAFLVPAAFLGAALVPRPEPSTAVSIFVRRDDGPEPGIAIFAVRPDGREALVRKVPDRIVVGGGRLAAWGAVSPAGQIALSATVGPWPMFLLDLVDPRSTPWLVDGATLGGIAPKWGPTGLVAADAGSVGGTVVVADPVTHTTRLITTGGLVGGGPSIVWTADGQGIVGSTGEGSFHVVPIDGRDPHPGVGPVFDPRGWFGPGLATLRICSSDTTCRGGSDGRVERVELDGTSRTVWRQDGADRALAASFGAGDGEYWLSIDHEGGRQVVLGHVQDGRTTLVSSINHDASWGSVTAPLLAPDGSSFYVGIDLGGEPAGVNVPMDGAPPTFHTGSFAGFVDRAASATFASGTFGPPAETMPPTGRAYALPSLDELIAAELSMNPGRTVLGTASRDGVDGETGVRTYDVPLDQRHSGEIHLDCLGPSSVTITSGAHTYSSPCLRAGTYIFTLDPVAPVTLAATGDTSWRVVIYST